MSVHYTASLYLENMKNNTGGIQRKKYKHTKVFAFKITLAERIRKEFKIACLNAGKETLQWLNTGQIKEFISIKRITKNEEDKKR